MKDLINTTIQSNKSLDDRLKIYQFFSTVFETPSVKTYETLQKLSKELTNLKVPTLPQLLEEHAKIFGHSITLECPPYETYYGPRNLFQQVDELSKISGFYRAFGLNIAKDFPDRPDHISVELEFMGFLTLKEILAEADEQREIVQNAQKKFLLEHLGRWGSAFAGLVVRNSPEGSFHHECAKLLKEFLEAERSRLEVKPEPLMDLVKWPVTTDEGCGSCK